MMNASSRIPLTHSLTIAALSLGLIASNPPAPPGAAARPSPIVSGAPEPSGPLNAGARLVRLTGSGRQLRAVVEIDLLSHGTGAAIEVIDSPGAPPHAPPGQGRTLARARLERGKPATLTVESPVVDGIDNQLGFRVRGRGDDGSVEEVNVYLVVLLDESTAPTIVGDTLVYEGAVVTQVQP